MLDGRQDAPCWRLRVTSPQPAAAISQDGRQLGLYVQPGLSYATGALKFSPGLTLSSRRHGLGGRGGLLHWWLKDADQSVLTIQQSVTKAGLTV